MSQHCVPLYSISENLAVYVMQLVGKWTALYAISPLNQSDAYRKQIHGQIQHRVLVWVCLNKYNLNTVSV